VAGQREDVLDALNNNVRKRTAKHDRQGPKVAAEVFVDLLVEAGLTRVARSPRVASQPGSSSLAPSTTTTEQ
jgi:hypothetical protein